MKLPDAFEFRDDRIAIELPGATAAFTTRRGGFSRGPYTSLNLGRFTDDDPQLVERNRATVAAQLGVELHYARQVHGARVTRIDPASSDAAPREADGEATAQRGIGPMVLTADCLPIAVAAQGAVAMLHAGWRGLTAGVIEEGIRAVRELGGDGEIEAAIGPGAGPCCYEVGEEVHAVFTAYAPEARRGNNLDLKAIARSQLIKAGVDSIHDVGLCTICSDPELFYSHRRDHGVTGRQAGIAWRS
jgi:polyphenol oxidase